MTGRWLARRGATVKRNKFDAAVRRVVPHLGRTLSTLRVSCLRDLLPLSPARYWRAVAAIHEAVYELSALRATSQVGPVFGSKVLHHYFPSVEPVYDRRYILIGVLRLHAFKSFLTDDQESWLLWDSPQEAGGPRMLDYHRYFAFCAAGIAEAKKSELRLVRRQFGEGFADLEPRCLAAANGGLLWQLDAKLAEYCLVGMASSAGLLG